MLTSTRCVLTFALGLGLVLGACEGGFQMSGDLSQTPDTVTTPPSMFEPDLHDPDTFPDMMGDLLGVPDGFEDMQGAADMEDMSQPPRTYGVEAPLNQGRIYRIFAS